MILKPRGTAYGKTGRDERRNYWYVYVQLLNCAAEPLIGLKVAITMYNVSTIVLSLAFG